MTRVSFILLAALAAAPAMAQDSDGKSLMEQGMEQFFEGLRDEMAPALRDLRELADEYGPAMRSFVEEMGPALSDILTDVEDWTRYEAPEVLPNGDIIIRRKPDPEETPEETSPRPSAPSEPMDI